MDDPKVIAGKYAKEVNEAIDGAAQVATDAYDKINADPPAYETKDAIKSFFDLTRIAIQGAADIARIPLQTTARPPGAAARRPRHDGRAPWPARGHSGRRRSGKYHRQRIQWHSDRNELVKSAVKMARIGMLRSAEIAQTIAAGPGAYADPVLISDDIPHHAMNLRPHVEGGDFGPQRRSQRRCHQAGGLRPAERHSAGEHELVQNGRELGGPSQRGLRRGGPAVPT